ncbi:MAG: hypothetical protein ACREQW_07995 [Candidatus Binatia bacterium]
MMPVLYTAEVVQALDLKGYIEAMGNPLWERGKTAAITAPRTEAGIPLLKYGISEKIKREARKTLVEVREDGDPRQSPEWMKARKESEKLNYRIKP